MRKVWLILLIPGLSLYACASQAAPILGTWKLTAYGPAEFPIPAVTDVDATLTFNADGKVRGSGGCNQLSGEYEANGDRITFSRVASTLMACEEPQMRQEGVVHQVLADTAAFKIEDGTLTITRENLILVLRAVPTK